MPEPGEAEMPFPPLAPGAGNPRDTQRAGALQRLRGISLHRPEWWMMLLSAAGWLFLAAGPHAHTGRVGTRVMAGQAAGLAAMVIAMMLPLTIGCVTETGRSSSGRLRARAFASFLSGYLAVWMLAMVAIDAAWRLTVSAVGWTAAVGAAIAAAVLCEIAPAKWSRWRRRGGGVMPLTPRPRQADTGSVRSGMAAGSSCVASCWALMAACVAFAHSLPVMAAIFVVQLHGRYRRPAFPALAALAVLGICLVSLALTMAAHHHHPQI